MVRRQPKHRTAVRIALALWCVALPILPVPASGEPSPPDPPQAPCCPCNDIPEAPRGCEQASKNCCSTQSGCTRIVTSSSTMVFLAPDGAESAPPYRQGCIRLDDRQPRDVFYVPENPPPQISAPS